VLVDEYQDTNRVQYLLTRHLAGWHGNLAVCGDPDQSIYGWRGADIRNILDFEADFGSARVEVVKLEQNYRSTRAILAAAQGVIRHNTSRKEKTSGPTSRTSRSCRSSSAGTRTTRPTRSRPGSTACATAVRGPTRSRSSTG
jgi:superfamily I DNA/RNA helicase